jgi:hypothetical protein
MSIKPKRLKDIIVEEWKGGDLLIGNELVESLALRLCETTPEHEAACAELMLAYRGGCEGPILHATDEWAATRPQDGQEGTNG